MSPAPSPRPTCASDRRRAVVRLAGLNGLVDVEVSEDRLHLCVHFLDGIPADVVPASFRIDGGRRITDVAVVSLRVRRPGDGDDDCLELTLDKPGDPSEYRLCIVELDEQGRPTGRPYPGFDVRYGCVSFRFTVDCPTVLDCAPEDGCPEPDRRQPPIDYLARDYASFRRLILDRMSLLVPGWSERHVPDLGVTLVELLASLGDRLAYAQDAIATEAYLRTARHRISVRRHARFVDYVLSEGCNARSFVVLTLDGVATWTPPASDLILLTSFEGAPTDGAILDGDHLPHGRYECFQPVADADESITVVAARNTVSLWTWGDQECCLPVGSTMAWLVDRERGLGLQPGDLFAFEEVRGARTGDPADADPGHRHVVRLTEVTETTDELFGVAVLEVRWADADALPFSLCLSSIGPAPGCEPIDEISVGRGNVIVVDHGRPVGPEPLDPVRDPDPIGCCEGPCQPADDAETPGRYRPRPLRERPVTFAAALDASSPAASVLLQNPREAIAAVVVSSESADPSVIGTTVWHTRPDLLASGPSDLDVVAEIDDDGAAHLRFGDGRLGRTPAAGDRCHVDYRVGNGVAGNVGADTIVHVARRGIVEHGITVRSRNLLSAAGGADPEPVAIAKRLAPRAFRSLQQRAIVAADYEVLARRESPRLQAASAVLRWTGSWYEVLVSADERGHADPEPAVLTALAGRLENFRRMGHDVMVAPARSVPVTITLSVCVAAHHRHSVVAVALGEVFSSRRPGGTFHPDRLVPGGSIASSVITAAAQSIDGVESVEVIVLRRLFGPTTVPVPVDGVLRFGPTEVARVDSDPLDPDLGSIDFVMRGGR